jgi:hypothetical protein
MLGQPLNIVGKKLFRQVPVSLDVSELYKITLGTSQDELLIFISNWKQVKSNEILQEFYKKNYVAKFLVPDWRI